MKPKATKPSAAQRLNARLNRQEQQRLHAGGARTATPVAVSPNADLAEYHRQTHAFLEALNFRLTNPSGWPLAPEEQAQFVRWVLAQAQQLGKMKGYHLTKLSASLAAPVPFVRSCQ